MVCANLDTSVCKRFAGERLVLRARLLDGAGMPIRAADVVSVEFSIRSLGSNGAGVSVVFDANPVELLLPMVAIDREWTIDDVGYNFQHELTEIVDLIDAVAAEFDGRVEVKYTFTLVDCRRATVSFYLRVG